MPPLCRAAATGQLPALRTLLKHGASLDVRAGTAMNHAFHFAASSGHTGVLCALAALQKVLVIFRNAISYKKNHSKKTASKNEFQE